MYLKEGTYFVTARTQQSRLLLRPSTQTNEVIGGVLGRAARLYKVRVYGFVVTSNHLHLLVHVRDGGLSRFMQYLLGNIAIKVGRMVRWSGAFWQRRFAAEPVLDDGALVRRLRYILEHGVKEGLVRTVAEWPGLSCVGQLLGEATRTFKWFNWAKRWTKGKLRPELRGLFDERFAQDEPLTVAPLPPWERLSPEERRERVLELIADIEKRGSKTKRKARPAAAVLQMKPHTRPRRTKKSPRPHSLCHASSRGARAAFREQYRQFVAWHRVGSQRFRGGELFASFPPFAFRPPILHAIDELLARYKASGT
jgi:REP element-mobilizing transposase RayT